MLISCCINTYKRPILLDQLLASIQNQKLPKHLQIEIIVVDNDKEELARPIINNWIKKNTVNIKYFTQPIQNISITRNKAVEEARGALIVFIDDDGIANENWISHLYNTIETYNADGIFGTVLPYFEEGVEDWIQKTNFFERVVQETGEDSKYFRTGNCMVKSSIIKTSKNPFDPNLGLTGGEDSDLFRRLKKKGYKFVFCKEAIVYDFVPKERANIKYLSSRFYGTGITTIEGRIKASKNKILTRLYFFSRSLILVSLSVIAYVLCIPIRKWRAHWQIKLASYSGHLVAVFNYRFEGYKK